MDFKTSTNPALSMEWQDATGANFNGVDHAAFIVNSAFPNGISVPNMVQTSLTDTTGAPFPGGYLRLRNAGIEQGIAFDVLITVPLPEETLHPSDVLPIQYVSPVSASVSQATLTGGGLICLGLSVDRSSCPLGGEPSAVDATCPAVENADGTTTQQSTVMRGAQFDVQLVETGTTTPIDVVGNVVVSFYDVDGD